MANDTQLSHLLVELNHVFEHVPELLPSFLTMAFFLELLSSFLVIITLHCLSMESISFELTVLVSPMINMVLFVHNDRLDRCEAPRLNMFTSMRSLAAS